MKYDKYFSFPIPLLKGFLANPKYVIGMIVSYCVYKLVYSDKAKYPSIIVMENDMEFRIRDFGIDQYKVESIGQELYDSLDGNNAPYVGARILTLRRNYSGIGGDYGRVCFLMYLAMKSIIQKKRFQRNVSLDYIFSRMSGECKKVPKEKIDPEVFKWRSRKKYSRVLLDLELNFGLLKLPGKSRGITYSFETNKDVDRKNMNHAKLIYLAEVSKRKERVRRLKHEKEKARRKVLEYLEKERNGLDSA